MSNILSINNTIFSLKITFYMAVTDTMLKKNKALKLNSTDNC